MPAWCGQTLIISGLLAAVVALACRLGRFSPATRHALWLLVLIKLLTPPVISYPASWPGLRIALALPQPVMNAADTKPEIVTFRCDTTDPVVRSQLTVVPEDTALVDEMRQLLSAKQRATARETVLNSTDYWRLAGQIADSVWFSGAAVFLVIQLERIRRFRRLLADPLVNTTLETQIRGLARGLGVRPPQLLVVRATVSPMIWGWGRPKLIWPLELGEQLSPAARRGVLVHELAHLARRDHWVGWLELAAGSVWWWNPLYWYVRFQLHENSELACDAWVTAQLPQDRRAYAEALIEVSQLVSVATAPIAAVGMSRSGRHTFERRLKMIMRKPMPHRLTIAKTLGVGLLGLAVSPSLSDGQVLPGATPAPPAAQSPSSPTAVTGPATTAPGAATNDAAPPSAGLPAPPAPGTQPVALPEAPGAAPQDASAPSAPHFKLNTAPNLIRVVPATPESAAKPAAPAAGATQTLLPSTVTIVPGMPGDAEPVHAGMVRQNKRRIKELYEQIAILKKVDADLAAKNGYRIVGNQQRIQELCDQVELLQKADADMAAAAAKSAPVAAAVARPVPAANSPLRAILSFVDPKGAVVETAQNVPTSPAPVTPDLPGADQVRVLTRATYKLPAGKAAVLITFLNEMLPDDIESKENGDSVTITASNEAQAVIARFISLLAQTKSTNKTSSNEGNSLPRAAAYLAPVPGATLPTAASK